jgi:O-acetyl-ADP-ribose deacetylase (regulator of RNase III)
VITTAGKLPCKAVIHTVGPRMNEGDDDNKLLRAVQSTLALAAEKEFKNISMPAINSGIFGFQGQMCKDTCRRIKKILVENKSSLESIEFCIFDNETLLL